ncbi:MAG TPA: serine/threonine protein kinase, partial [Myxococcus sp.]|nr:serine/threonine protein kinase [Myxococcus sp.]
LYTGQQATRREELARRFTEQVEHIEALARYSGLSPLHDTREDHKGIREHMARLEAQILQAGGPLAAGPGNYALARGHLALGDEAKARPYLESAWNSGFQDPRVAYSLALVLGHLYQEELLEAESQRDTTAELREARRKELQRRYRDPALQWLRKSEGADVPSTEYVEALIAFYEERFDEALARLDALARTSAWFYEVRQLRADVYRTRASLRWSGGDREGALADFEAGRRDYAAAADTARSVPGLYLAQGELELAALTLELYSQGEVLPLHERGREAVRRALVLAPDQPEVRLLEARIYRRLAEFQLNRWEREAADRSLQQALGAAQAALELTPGASQAHLELGRCFGLWGQSLQRQGQDPSLQLQQAEAHLQQVPPEDRDSAYHVFRGVFLEARFNHALEVGPDSLPWLDRALESYLEATRLNGKLLTAWLNLANAYRKRAAHPGGVAPDEDLKRARDAAAHARALNARHSFLFYLEGQIDEQDAWRHRARGDDARPLWTRALELYRQGLALDARQTHLRNREGSVLLELAREAWERGGAPWKLLDEARVAFQAALAVSPAGRDGQHNLDEVLLHRARYERAQAASPEASLGALLRGHHPPGAGLKDASFPWMLAGAAHALLSEFALEQGRDPGPHLARAEEALGEALARNASDWQALQYRGVLHAVRARWRARQGQGRSEDFSRAAEDFEAAIALKPRRVQDVQVWFGHFCHEWAAWARAAGQDFETPLKRGLAQAGTLLAARPGWADALVLQARLLALSAQTEAAPVQQRQWRQQAREALSRALAVNPQLTPRWMG